MFAEPLELVFTFTQRPEFKTEKSLRYKTNPTKNHKQH